MLGYIKLYRKTMCSPIWQDPYYLKLWMYCLMKASHKEHKQLVGNQVIVLQPGEFVTGRTSLSEDLNKGMKPKQKQSEISWWRYINNIEQWGMLNIKKTNKYSVVSIVKWHEYQESEQQVNINRTSNEHQLNTNKNVKNDKNENLYAEVVNYLNEKAGTNFKHTTKKTKELIKARSNEKFSKEDMFLVIDYCCTHWKGKVFANGNKGDDYLQPSTLFNNKFDERLQKALKAKEEIKPVIPVEQETEGVLAGIWGEEY